MQSVKWICVIGLMILSTNAASASLEKPEKPETIDPAYELILLDRIDTLTVDLIACEKKLALKEEPPIDDGFPWLEVVIAAASGYIIKDILD